LTGLEIGRQRCDPKLYNAKGMPAVDVHNPIVPTVCGYRDASSVGASLLAK